MAGQTPRFGFNYFGGETSGTLDDDNDKFTLEDRLLLDRLLAALEAHDHHGTPALHVPSVAPVATLIPGGGELEAGSTYYYVVSFVDSNGLETISGPETSCDTPELLEVPDVPQGDTTTGGFLQPGSYTYALSALRDTEETPLGNPSAITILDGGPTGEYTVTFTLPDLGDADALQLWRMKDTDGSYTRIVTSSSGTAVDDGSVPAGLYGDPANFVPLVTTGIDNYAISVALAGDDVTDLQSTQGWRLYRSTESGIYGSNSLVHEVVEHTTDTDPDSDLIDTWIDDGDDPLVGSPRTSIASALRVPALTFASQNPLPDPAGYPDYAPIVDGSGNLFLKVAGAWKPVDTPAITRGVATYTGHGAPTTEPVGSLAGDLYIDVDSGDVYTLAGP